MGVVTLYRKPRERYSSRSKTIGPCFFQKVLKAGEASRALAAKDTPIDLQGARGDPFPVETLRQFSCAPP